MQTIINFLFLFSVLNSPTEGRYERHNQFCGGMNGADVKWSLDMKGNKMYALKITEIRNEYGSKPKVTFIGGTWQSVADTLTLSNWEQKEDVLVFYKKEGRLIFQSNKSTSQSSSLVYLDYLEKLSSAKLPASQ